MAVVLQCQLSELAGHFHVGATGYMATRYQIKNYAALIVFG